MVLGVVFALYAIGLTIIRIPGSILKAAGIALVDFIPIAGSGIVMIPWAIIKLVQGQRNMALALGLVFVIIAVLRMVIEPIITGRQVGLHPLITMPGAAIQVFPLDALSSEPVAHQMEEAGELAEDQDLVPFCNRVIAVILTTIVRLQSFQTVQTNERQERRKRRSRE